MLYNRVEDLYRKFRLMHYRSLFGRIREREGSLSATEAFAVDVIYLLGEPTVKQFSDYLGISQPNATYKVNNLISKGYIEKVPSSEDKREVRLLVSDHFFEYYGQRSQFIDGVVEKLGAKYTAEEINKFEDMLGALADAMSD